MFRMTLYFVFVWGAREDLKRKSREGGVKSVKEEEMLS